MEMYLRILNTSVLLVFLPILCSKYNMKHIDMKHETLVLPYTTSLMGLNELSLIPRCFCEDFEKKITKEGNKT